MNRRVALFIDELINKRVTGKSNTVETRYKVFLVFAERVISEDRANAFGYLSIRIENSCSDVGFARVPRSRIVERDSRVGRFYERLRNPPACNLDVPRPFTSRDASARPRGPNCQIQTGGLTTFAERKRR